MSDSVSLALPQFVPYRISVLSNIISRTVAHFYADQFELTIPEWRVLVVLGENTPPTETLCANSVAQRTAMDKVQVSRAISRMLQADLIERTTDREDRRRSILNLTTKGYSVYTAIVPAAQRYEAEVLAGFSESDLATLNHLLDRLTQSAKDVELAVATRSPRLSAR